MEEDGKLPSRMIAILDTNHLRELVSESSDPGKRLWERIDENDAEVFASIVVVEESIQGWLALLRRHDAGPGQVGVYARMQETLEAAVGLGILPFDVDAAEIFVELRRSFRRHGTMDLKIAAICLAHDAILLTRNHVDFRDIPSLRVQDWLG